MKRMIGILCLLVVLFSLPALAQDDEQTDETDYPLEGDEMIDDQETEPGDQETEQMMGDQETGLGDQETEEEMDDLQTDPVDQETEEEIALFADRHGAQIRIYQLERAILKTIIAAKTVAGYGQDLPDVDAQYLEDLIAEMEDIHSSVLALSPSSPTAVSDFVHYKRDIIDLTKQFREYLSGKLGAEDRRAIHEAVKNAIASSEDLQGIHDRIRERNAEYNAQRVRDAFARMGVEEDDIIDRVRKGEASGQDVKYALKNAYDGLTPEEKRVLRQRANVEIKKAKEMIQEVATQVRNERAERVREELRERIERMPEDRKERIREQIEMRIEQVDNGRTETAQGRIGREVES